MIRIRDIELELDRVETLPLKDRLTYNNFLYEIVFEEYQKETGVSGKNHHLNLLNMIYLSADEIYRQLNKPEESA